MVFVCVFPMSISSRDVWSDGTYSVGYENLVNVLGNFTDSVAHINSFGQVLYNLS